MEVIVEHSLMVREDIYFEAGGYVDIIHMSGNDFHNLLSNTDHGILVGIYKISY